MIQKTVLKKSIGLNDELKDYIKNSFNLGNLIFDDQFWEDLDFYPVHTMKEF